MKIGVRKPNIKNRVKSRTTGRAKRAVKSSVNPLYGKKGIGYVNDPERAVKNKIYKKTTISAEDAAGSVAKSGKKPGKKKGCLVFVLGFLALFVSCSLMFSDSDDKSTKQASTEATTEVAVEVTTSAPEATTAAMALGSVEGTKKIKAKSKADAASATREELNTAANYINENLPGCFDDQAKMEQILAYGYLLYYHYGQQYTAGDLGYSAVKAVRPVYEDGIDPGSEEVQLYVSKVSDDIDKIVNGTAINPTKATTESTTETSTEAKITYILNTSSKKYHAVNGPDIDTISPENRQETTKSSEELESEGYTPCGRCY